MLLTSWRGFAANHCRLIRGVALSLCCLLSVAALHAQVEQNDAALEKIHRRLTNTEKLSYHRPIVFVGEISALGAVFQGVCKSGVNQSVDFTVSRLLFGKFSETVVHTGYINCTMRPLPSPPFTVGAHVIVYCEQFHSLSCLTPVEFTEARQRTVEGWITAIPPDLAKQEDRGDSILWALHVPLEDPDRLAKRQGFLFEGEISRHEEIHQRRCASGLEQKIDYRVKQVLWDYPDSQLGPGYVVSKDFIDCRRSPLPNWGPGTRVIAFCEALPGQGYNCLAPVMFTDDRLFRVKQWITELSAREGNPELLKMHSRLRDSLELAPSRPLLLLGQVTALPPKRSFVVQSVPMIPTMRVAVSRLLWGYYKEAEANVECPHRDCSNVSVGAKLIAYCEALGVYRGPQAFCRLATVDASDENIHRAEQWAAQARQHQPALIIEQIRKYLATRKADPRSAPSVYRGHATWVGKADNGIPLVHFTDITGKVSQPVNLLIQRHYFTEAPIAVEIGKPMITFCVQRDDVCYSGEETTGIVEDSDETFRVIREMIEGTR
jgi:hypothetical protein